MADKPDRLIVSMDLALPVDPAGDPMEYHLLLQGVTLTLREVYGIEVKFVAGTVAESQYDMPAEEEPVEGDGISTFDLPPQVPHA
jgi:hypothetical protein